MYTIRGGCNACGAHPDGRGVHGSGAATEVAGSLVLPDSIVAAADHAVALAT